MPSHIVLPDRMRHPAKDWDSLKTSVLKPNAAFWQIGTAELSIDFESGEQMTHLLILWEKSHGFHLLHWRHTLDDPLVALSAISFLELVEFEICGELIRTPAAMFITPKAACAAITSFLQTGEPDPTLVWVRKREQNWDGPQGSRFAIGVPLERMEELTNKQRKKKPPSPIAAFFQRMRARDYDGVLADIQAGINLNRRFQSEHPVTLACQLEDPKLLGILLQHGASPDATNADGWTGLHLTKSEQLALLLLDSRANVNARIPGGATPLHRMSSQAIAMAAALISRGAEVNARDDMGRTPLIRAAAGGQAEFADLLLHHAANVNATDQFGASALLWLFRHSQRVGATESVLKVLFRHGADLLAREPSGEDALMSYCDCGAQLEVVQQFLDAGADPYRTDELGRSAISIAQQRGSTELAEYLIRHSAPPSR